MRVIGHASSRTREMDWVRHKMVNLNVSLDRANAVASVLVRSGVADEIFRKHGFGTANSR